MTLMDAKQYDEAPDRRRRKLIIFAVLAAIILAWLGYHLRNYAERRAADKLFAALKARDFEGAYATWLQDPQWKQHPGKNSKYGYADFYQDWGPGGEWGAIKSYSIDCSYSSGSGVIVETTLNNRAEHADVWVDKSDKSIHFSPNEIECGNWWGWLTE